MIAEDASLDNLSSVISQLQSSAKEIVEERSKAEALFTSIGDGAIVTDENGRISRINKPALDMLGYTRKELVGKWFPKAIVATSMEGEPIKPLFRSVTQSFIDGKTVSQRLCYLTKNGKSLPVVTTVSPIIHDSKPIGAIEVFRDISLEHEVDRMKSEFISIASHQLRTPLSTINTYAQMLAHGFEGDLSPGQQKHMAVIISAVDRMNDLISTLLDISQLEAGKISVTLQETDMTKLLERLIQELGESAQSKDIKLMAHLPKETPIVNCDPLLVGEIYSNLISNAIKYTPKKGKVSVELRATESEILFIVSDTGYGIPKGQHDRVFTKFFRAENVQKKDTTGTGLGLYMVRQIAETLGGRVWFKSDEGKGSTFYFGLPRGDT